MPNFKEGTRKPIPLARIADARAPIVYGIVQPGPNCPEGVPFVQSRDVGGVVDISALQRTTHDIAKQYHRSVISGGDILFSLRGNIGQSSLTPTELEGANIARGIARIRVGDKYDAEFVRYVLQGPFLERLIARNANGSTFREISIEELRKLPIPSETLAEQRRAAAILRTWDEALENLAALRTARERSFKAVSQKLLAPSRATGRNIPKSNWTFARFGDVFEERRDRNDGLGADVVVTVGKYAIRNQSEHFTRSVASADLSNYWVISPGDFVYDPMSAYYGALGRYDGKHDGILSPAYRVIRLNPIVHSDFMVHLLRSHHIRFLLEARSSQGNKEGKRRLLQRDEFSSIEFHLPPMEVQQEIAIQLATFQRAVALIDHQIDTVARQKRGLMQKLLTGEWRVTDRN